jgi:flagellar assembly protein FliH
LQRAIAEGFHEGSERGYRDGQLLGEERGLEEGRVAGHAQGLSDGIQEGRKEGRLAFDQASSPLVEMSERFKVFVIDFEITRRQELLALVKKVSEQVIRCELTLNPGQLLTLTEEALANMPSEAQDVSIHLHPDECTRIKDLVPERAAAWRLVANESLALGECRIVTSEAEMDIGCQQRLDACVDTLSEHLHLIED